MIYTEDACALTCNGTHPNPSLKQGGARLRGESGADSPSLFQGGGQGVGTFTE